MGLFCGILFKFSNRLKVLDALFDICERNFVMLQQIYQAPSQFNSVQLRPCFQFKQTDNLPSRKVTSKEARLLQDYFRTTSRMF